MGCRNVPADMARQEPRREIVAAARPVADDQIDLTALVEGLNGVLGLRGDGSGGEHGRYRETDCYTASTHRHERPLASARRAQ